MVIPTTTAERLRKYKDAHSKAYDAVEAALSRERKAKRTRGRTYRALLKIRRALHTPLDFGEVVEDLASDFKRFYVDIESAPSDMRKMLPR